MAITVKHTKVSTIPDGDDTSVVRPSDWNADHQLTGTIPVDNGGTGASTLTGYVKGNGTAAMTAASTIPSTDVTGLGTMSTQNSNNISVTGGSMSGVTISDYVATATKGVANGVASLDGSGTVPISQLPSAVLGALSYQGTWNASTNTPTLTSSVGTKGYYYVVSVAGSTNLNGITDWVVGDWAVYNGTAWQKVDNTDAVTSVNGYTGTVVLTNTDISGFGTMSTQNANAVAITGGAIDGTTIGATTTSTGKFTTLNASTSLTTPIVQASNSGGLSLKNSAGTTQISMGAGGGDNASINVSTNMNGTNAQIDISPTGTGHVHMKPTGTGSIEIAPTNVGTIDNMTIGATTARAITGTTITATSFVGSGASLTNVVNSLAASTGISVSGSTGAVTVTNTAPDQTVALTAGTGISTSGTYPNFTITNTAPSSGGTVTSVTGTAPVVSSGGNTPAISMAAATGSVNGYLTSTDWTTFNNKGSGTVTSVATGTGLSGGPITGTGTISLANTAVTPAAYTNANITVDAQGRITSASNGSGGSGTVTSVAATVPSLLSVSGSPITTSGTLAFTYSGTALPVANGGSGQTSYTDGQLLIGNTTGNTLTKATLTAGIGISVTNGAGSITIANTSLYTISYLIVGGGGGGGYNRGGGAGAGGVLSGTNTITRGVPYTFVVGGGGAGATALGTTGVTGTSSTAFSLTALGGGGGASSQATTGRNGGDGASGGGGSTDISTGTSYGSGGSGTTGQGFAGGSANGAAAYAGGGGGGSSAVGGNATTTVAGSGGAGTASSITGSSVTYAGGGGGSVYSNAGTAGSGGAGGGGAGGAGSATVKNNGVAGTANTGGGGGGGNAGPGAIFLGDGGQGGSGVIIISIPTANYTGTTTGSPTVTTSGSNTILTFTASGSYTA